MNVEEERKTVLVAIPEELYLALETLSEKKDTYMGLFHEVSISYLLNEGVEFSTPIKDQLYCLLSQLKELIIEAPNVILNA